MLAYGLVKILGMQFILPSSVYEYQLKELDGVTLAWAFLGFSPWFSVMLGFFELVPGVLLLFNRTKLLGAVLLFPIVLTVFLINNAYDFLPHMRVLTGVLLLMNLSLLLYDYKLFIRFSHEILRDQSTIKLIELIINFILIGSITFLIIYNLK